MIIVIIILVILLAVQLSFFNKKIYCYIFEHEDWKKWESYIRNVSQFQYEGNYPLCCSFIVPNTDITAEVWKETGLCSIHDNYGCVLSTFDKYHSKKIAKLLMNKINNHEINR